MTEPPSHLATSGKLKEQYTPLSQHESQHPDWKRFAWTTAKFFIVTKLSAIAGTIVGKAMKMPTMKFGIVQTNHGTSIGATMGAIYELFHHWKETTGKQLRILDIKDGLNQALDPAPMKMNIERQQRLFNELQELETIMTKSNHAEEVLANRADTTIRHR